MEVKYLDLQSQFKENREVRRVIDEILSSGQFVMGRAVEEFERNFAQLCGVKHAIGVSNGTDAIFLALKVLGIGKDDEVITVPNTFLATVGAIVQTGAFPRLVDVADDYNIDPNKIEAAINERTRAIVPVHLTGNPARMDEIRAIAEKHSIFVVADAAQAIDASINGEKVGSLGDLAAFSLHPLKNLNTCGDGGVITTDSDDYHQQLQLYRNHGLKNRNEAQFFAYNCRLDSIKAAVANLQIKTIGEVTEKRNRNVVLYDEGLAGLEEWVKIPLRQKNIRQSFHTYVIQVEDRNKLISFLKEKGVETKIYYPIPIHLMAAAKKYGYKKGDFPVAETQANRIISLPIHQYLSDDHINHVIGIIRSFYKAPPF
ncbi:MAG: DegT/DnrJ/EryC1/StrS family aminotransferase [Candidatus Auribacterota bacterium]|nr:DegT/DnrJ/EryC1/StrS family aminotransferase [Candidatus Auribacterota bacterium]